LTFERPLKGLKFLKKVNNCQKKDGKKQKEERLAPLLFLFKTRPSGKYRGKTPAK
jgi:hypothetical protein